MSNKKKTRANLSKLRLNAPLIKIKLFPFRFPITIFNTICSYYISMVFFFAYNVATVSKLQTRKKNGLKCLMSYNVSDEIAASGWQKKRLKKLNFIIKYNVSNRHCIVEQKPSLEKKSSKQDLVKSPHVSRQLALGRH